ncbi:MAG: metallophosphoesterase family protein [Candidatus Bathyarchaeia archaeon]
MLNELIKKSIKASPKELVNLIDNVKNIIIEERENKKFNDSEVKEGLILIPPAYELLIVGDIHGDLESLKYILESSLFLNSINSSKPQYIIFLGDYGDRGIYSPEVYYVILYLKSKFPKYIHLLRGNHEGPPGLMAYPHDLPHQLESKFGEEAKSLYIKFKEFFKILYHAIIIEGKYLLLHGGIPSEAESINDIAYANLTYPNTNHLEEILWSDPYEGIFGTYPSPRGAGKLFGKDITNKVLDLLGVKTLIRGHEPCLNGVKVNHDGKVLTIFSRKGYPYHNLNAAYLKLRTEIKAMDAYELVNYCVKF